MTSAYDLHVEEDRISKILGQLKNEYIGKASNNHKKLSLLGLDMNSLPRDLMETSQMCATFSVILGLEDINKNALMVKSTEMMIKDHHDHKMQFETKMKGMKVKKILKDLENQTNAIKRMCGIALNESECLAKEYEKKAASIAFLEEKLRAYNDKVQKLDETICEIGPGFDIKEVIKSNELIKSMDEEKEELQAKLNRYRELPPNMILAREKLEEEKAKLEKCEEELADFVENYISRHQ